MPHSIKLGGDRALKKLLNMKKEIVYTMPYVTEADIKKANAKRSKLYEKYNSVQVYPNGMYEVRIIATNSI